MSVSSERLLAQLTGIKGAGKGAWMALCPAHDDKAPSLSIREIAGQTLIYDHGGCQTFDVLASVGLGLSDLFDEPRGNTYEYRDSDGTLNRRVHRSPTKEFRQEVVSKEAAPLYHLGEVEIAVTRGDLVWVTEGEKDADVIRSLGKTATTTAGGARNWHKSDWLPMRGAAAVNIAADADEAGMARARELKQHLGTFKDPAVGPIRIWITPERNDIADHILAGGTLAGLLEVYPEPVDPNAFVLTSERLRDLLEDTEDQTYDWLIPDLIERRERLIITGGEGVGKMVLIRQLTLLPAAGIHPFTGAKITPVEVLVFDVENSRRQWSRQAEYVTNRARSEGKRDPGEHYHLVLQQDFDIRRPVVIDEIHRMIDLRKPDLVVMAPLYRLTPRGMNDDEAATPVLAALNTITAKGCALIMEAHAGKDAGRTSFGDPNSSWAPRGSAALKGWPEFGFGLAPIDNDPEMVAVRKWRGDREQREWPTYLTRARHPGDWPWNASYQAQGNS